MRRMALKLCGGILAVAGLVSLLPVYAQTTNNFIDIPVSSVVRGNPGDVHILATEPVDPGMKGRRCTASVQAQNQGSVHPDNDLLVKSDGTQLELLDVERAAGVVTNANGTLTLGDDVVVSLQLGSDGVFSAGMTVQLDCPEPVQVCRNGQVITVRPDEVLPTDTQPPCPVPEEPEQPKTEKPKIELLPNTSA